MVALVAGGRAIEAVVTGCKVAVAVSEEKAVEAGGRAVEAVVAGRKAKQNLVQI